MKKEVDDHLERLTHKVLVDEHEGLTPEQTIIALLKDIRDLLTPKAAKK